METVFGVGLFQRFFFLRNRFLSPSLSLFFSHMQSASVCMDWIFLLNLSSLPPLPPTLFHHFLLCLSSQPPYRFLFNAHYPVTKTRAAEDPAAHVRHIVHKDKKEPTERIDFFCGREK